VCHLREKPSFPPPSLSTGYIPLYRGSRFHHVLMEFLSRFILLYSKYIYTVYIYICIFSKTGYRYICSAALFSFSFSSIIFPYIPLLSYFFFFFLCCCFFSFLHFISCYGFPSLLFHFYSYVGVCTRCTLHERNLHVGHTGLYYRIPVYRFSFRVLKILPSKIQILYRLLRKTKLRFR
jgi:hypothetical protein